jgi:hypothetical protein
MTLANTKNTIKQGRRPFFLNKVLTRPKKIEIIRLLTGKIPIHVSP